MKFTVFARELTQALIRVFFVRSLKRVDIRIGYRFIVLGEVFMKELYFAPIL